MNGKVMKAVIAGAGALTLLGGGTTYAFFTGTSTAAASTITAGTVGVGTTEAGAAGTGALDPGKAGLSRTFLVTNTTGSAATIAVQLANLVNAENDCNGDEKLYDGDCDGTGSDVRGDLANQANVTVTTFAPVAGATPAARCPVPSGVPNSTEVLLAAAVNQERPFSFSDVLRNAAARCVRVDLKLPELGLQNHAVQGDGVTFDVRVRFTQSV